MPPKSPATLKFGSNPWFFGCMAAWGSFVFTLFFFKLYGSWPHFFPAIPSAAAPFTPHLTSIGQRLLVWKESFLAFSTGILVMGIFQTLGKRLFRWLSLEAPQPVRFCLEIGFGVFLLNLLWMGLGLVRLWVEPLWLAGFVFLTLLFLRDVLKLPDQDFSVVWPQGIPIWFWLVSIFYMGFLLLHSLLPETFYDSLNYFLGMPSFWVWNHGICDYPTHLLSGYFHGGSLFFMNGFTIAGTEGAKVLAAFVLFWTALFCNGWGKELAGSKAGAAAAVAVLTFPLLYLNSWAVRVDGLLTFDLLLFFYSVEKGVSEKKRNWIVAAGIFAGVALTIKPTAVVGIGAALAALLWRDGRSVLQRKGWMVFSAILFLEVGPWLLKNACFTGNAFFPYAVSWMGGRQFPAWSQARLLHENQQFLPIDHGILSLLNLPWRLTIPGAGDDQFIGPLLLAFLPLFFLLRFQNPTLRFLGRTLLLSFAFGLTLSHMLRFSMPAFVLAFTVLSVGLESLVPGRWKSLWAGAVVASAFFCFGQYLSVSAAQFDGWGIWSGRETRQEYLARKMASGYMNKLVESLPKEARLLSVGDARVLYYGRPVYANSVFDEPFFAAAARNEKDSGGILRRLRELGITHVVFEKELGPLHSREYHQYVLTAEEWEKLSGFVQAGLEPVSVNGPLGLYRVREKLSPNGPRPPNPFLFYPPQALNFMNDMANKNYPEAGMELKRLKSFFPGEDYWMKRGEELEAIEKSK